MNINLSKADLETIGIIVAAKSMEMYKKGASWHRNGKYLSCVDMVKIANKIVKPLGVKYDESFIPAKKQRI